jgi:hypothetical protein
MEQIRANYRGCLEDLANVWADMMCANYPAERLLPFRGEDGTAVGQANFALLRQRLLHARVDVTENDRYRAVGTQALLDRLLAQGHLTLEEYLERLPSWAFPDREGLLQARKITTEGKEG